MESSCDGLTLDCVVKNFSDFSDGTRVERHISDRFCAIS